MKNPLEILEMVPDPEIPVINVVELGIVRDAKVTGENTCEVTITPTYSACPAMFTIEEDIIKIMKENGWDAKVVTKMFPIWTTDWLTDEAREKLRAYGITPPEKGADEHYIGKPKKCPSLWFRAYQTDQQVRVYTMQGFVSVFRLFRTL